METHLTTMTSTSIRGQGTVVKVQVMSLALAPVMVQGEVGEVGAVGASEAVVDSPAAVVIYGLQARSRRRLRNSSNFNHSFSHSFSRHYSHLISNTARICAGSSRSSSSSSRS